ncbi:flagellar hook-associated protein FlgK [Acidihalobacter aeolianus]|uniref:Flagellar hook-associated protein 1 n=1 Tax=Acidihalobacter aeolianus TaxID=2792603 RepID=A0A1D8K6N7_9GAMM|nr:flagellar hook-associated protein FlgK [Acidihalobacter aeolianus]
MASTNILGVATSGLLAFQQALQTTSQNISNVNTPGYSRQTTNLGSSNPQLAGNYYLGTGVQVNGVQRIVSNVVNDQLNSATSANARYQTYSQYATQVDNLLGSSTAGLQPAVQSFFNAVQGVANSPSSIPARQTLLSQGGQLVSTFNSMYGQINQVSTQINGQLTSEVSTVNQLAGQIAALNQQIVNGTTGNPVGQPNDLLDQRDALLTQLSKIVNVSTVAQSDGSINVMIGTGQALVVGTATTQLATAPTSGDPNQLNLVFKTANGNIPVANVNPGGTLGGLLDARNNVVVPAENALGRLAIGIGQTFNAQQKLGIDLTGNLGQNFFNVPTPTVYAGANNATTSGVPSVTVSNVNQLTTNDYQLSYNGTSWTLQIVGTSQTVAMSGAGTAASPFTAGGLSIVAPTNATAGDTYTIEPTRYAARDISVAATDPRQIAAAAPVVSAANQTNIGTATISAPTVTAATISNPNLLDPVTITINNPPTTYTVTDTKTGTSTTPQPYNATGTTVSFNGWQVTLGGNASAGDTFTVTPSGPGDNGNALALAQIQQNKIFSGGTASIGDAYNQLVASVGNNTQAASSNASNQQALLNQVTSLQQSISGVNLDQEAANLVQYQQDYQASAKVISTANTLFQALLNAV